jgi:hypothetical protein
MAWTRGRGRTSLLVITDPPRMNLLSVGLISAPSSKILLDLLQWGLPREPILHARAAHGRQFSTPLWLEDL